ncbi:Protein of unknown function [Cotesia congregata]|uniref:Uncharacterized protein n=1 Tax=Cotesia congregata TaxID=51543 RepID=A0A8J2HEG4_COTCN|nr:Protein of unknown function [Cotesia congregata]
MRMLKQQLIGQKKLALNFGLFVEESPDIRRSERVVANQNNVKFKVPNFSTITEKTTFNWFPCSTDPNSIYSEKNLQMATTSMYSVVGPIFVYLS